MNVQKINYQKELDKILKRLEEEGRVPTLLIHSCCAPCSSYVLEYLSRYFRITVLYYKYDKEKFYEMAKGMEHLKEGGARCMKCYELRLEEAAQQAAEGRFDYFTTTLSISPLKNSQKLNEIGVRVGKKYGVEYLVSDFKKRNGYKRSVELSEEYGLYRQDYCGCEFSMREREHREKQFL